MEKNRTPQSDKPRCIIIAGPTATGKTALSVSLAQAFDGEIVNADSMQVYRGMDIGTAKPTDEEQKGIPHHLLDVVNPDEEFNAASYRRMALPLVTDIVSRQKTCFITGGTGLYIKSLTQGLFHCPPSDMNFRETLKRQCETDGLQTLYERLEHLDPESAKKLHPHDKFRIIRALEIAHLTEQRPSELIKSHNFSDTPLNALKICLDSDREKLYHRIDQRSLEMVANGLAEETENLMKKGYSPELKSMQSIGYRHMVNHLQGKWSLEEAIRNIQRDTRRYAKRQFTWFRGDPDYVWIGSEDWGRIKKKVAAFLTAD